jgi:lipoprotein-releasing system ATP-binding protein
MREPTQLARTSPRGTRVEIHGLTRSYHKGSRTIEVLRDIDMILEPGERVSIIGPSGSGKSTFLHAVGLLDRGVARWGARGSGGPQMTGRIRIDEHEVSLLTEAQRAGLRNRRIGFVFQAHNLLPEHTALGNVMIPVRVGGGSEAVARQRAEALLEAVGLGLRLDHRPGELSGGEQQRVAIARALVMGPGLVLADEPTGNLDPRTAATVFDLLVDLNVQLGSTLVVVTHSRDLASGFPRRLALEDGQFIDW